MDMGVATRRVYGGAGFVIHGFESVAAIEDCTDGFDVRFECQVEARTRDELVEAMGRLRDRAPNATGLLVVRAVAPEHVGLGSKTSLILAALKAVDLANDLRLSEAVLINLSGRGGASGVGVHAFFSGGFLVDAGHERSRAFSIGPSSSRTPASPPLLVLRQDFPADWVVHLLMPHSAALVSGKDEVEFFERHVPLPIDEVLLSIAALYHAVVPAICSGDLGLLAVGLDDLHSVGFKRRELDAQPDSAILRTLLSKASLPVGMSSMGPLVYAITMRNDLVSASLIQGVASEFGAQYLGAFEGENHGHVIR
jgi:beta-ribofuranosylaminobenzene 5'-phosphate synthase